MGFDFGDALNVASWAFPVTAIANGAGDIGNQAWDGKGPTNMATGYQGGGLDPFGIGSSFGVGGGGATTATGLTPQQVAAAQAAAVNPSAQGPLTGYTPPDQEQFPVFNEQGQIVEWRWRDKADTGGAPIYGTSVRDMAMEGFQAGPRDAPQATAGQMFKPRDVQGSRIGTSHMQPGQQVAGLGLGMTNDATANAARARSDQSAQTARLTNAADGLAPSVAENQLRAGMAQGMQQNLALAASNRGSGSSSVLAQRQAQNANAQLAARTNAQAAQLRAGEMAQARGDLTGHLAGVRGQDLQTGQLGTQVAGIGTQQMGIGAQLGTAQAGLNQQANLANQQTALATGQANLNAAQQTSLANLNAQMQQQGMDDQQRAMYLGAILGIDARTQQGQLAIQQLLSNATLTTQATNAGISLGNAQNATNQQNGLLSGAATFGAALI